MEQTKIAKWKDFYWAKFPYLYGLIAGLVILIWAVGGYNPKMEQAIELFAVACFFASAIQTPKNTKDQDILSIDVWADVKQFLINSGKFMLIFVVSCILILIITLIIEVGPVAWEYFIS